MPYLILDARYERVREDGIIVSQAVLIAVAVDWEGRRQILAELDMHNLRLHPITFPSPDRRGEESAPAATSVSG